MSELTECYADQAAINERYRTAHRDIAALRQRVAVLEEALRYFRERMLHYMEAEGFNQDTDSSPILDRIDEALATTEGE